jgi:hypothetical protein
MWFLEEAWPPAIVAMILAVVNLAVWYQHQKPVVLLPMVLWLGLGIAAFTVDARVVTERERVQAAIPQLIVDFRAKDRDKFLAHFSPDAPLLHGIALMALQKVELGADASLRDVSVEMQANDTRAKSRFRVQGTVTFDTINAGTVPTRWEVGWRREEGLWKILTVTRLNPLKDEPIEILAK